ncbi:MAG: hypothetical protein DSZ30_03755 [Aquificaceae bacterium]|nr:MAG: hypothetical protein DSZ30_03755 [Aquificaceae bacterium]
MEGNGLKLKRYFIKSYKDLKENLKDFPCRDLDLVSFNKNFRWFYFEKCVEDLKINIKKRIDILLIPKRHRMFLVLVEFKTLPLKTSNNKRFLILLSAEERREKIEEYLNKWQILEKFNESLELIDKILKNKTKEKLRKLKIFLFEDNIVDKKSLSEIYKGLYNPFAEGIQLLSRYPQFNIAEVIRETYNLFIEILKERYPDLEIHNCRRFKDFIELTE